MGSCQSAVTPFDPTRAQSLTRLGDLDTVEKMPSIPRRRPRHVRNASSGVSLGSRSDSLVAHRKLVRMLTGRLNKIELCDDERNKYDDILGIFPDGAVVLDSGSKILYANEMMIDIIDDKELVGKRLDRVFPSLPLDSLGLPAVHLCDPEGTRVHEYKLTLPGGRNLYLELRCMKFRPPPRVRLPTSVVASVVTSVASSASVSEVESEPDVNRLLWVRNVTDKTLSDQLAYKEQREKNALLEKYLPDKEIRRRYLAGERNFEASHASATVGFFDIVRFTDMVNQSPVGTSRILKGLYREMDTIIKRLGITKIDTAGDNYFVASGVSSDEKDPSADKVLDFMTQAISFARYELKDVSLRCGVAMGPVTTEVLGDIAPKFAVIGPATVLATRLEGTCEPNQIHISREVYEAIEGISSVASRYEIRPLTGVRLKGIGDSVDTYLLAIPGPKI